MARTRTPQGEDDSGGRARLLKAAMILFAAKGYAGTSVRDILKAAEVTAPALYYHFRSKEGLSLALAHEGIERIERACGSALSRPGTARERISRFCQARAAVRREYEDVAWVAEAILSGPHEAAPQVDFGAVIANGLQQLERLVGEGIERGEFRDCNPRDAALALMGAIEVSARPRTYQRRGVAADAQLEGMLEVIFAGLAAHVG